MTFDLSGHGRVAFITGAGSGIGRAMCDVFAEAEYRVLVADIDEAAGCAAADELRARGGHARFVKTDVTESRQVEAAVSSAMDEWGRLDFVVNNAGISGPMQAIDELDEEQLDAVLAVNLKGPFHVCKHAVRAQIQTGGGGILNVASITAETGSAYYSAYSAAKAGVMALTRSLARNLGRRNIRVNCLVPGSVSGTNFNGSDDGGTAGERAKQAAGLIGRIPLARTACPRDIAHLALFLASPLARHIHGAMLTIDGGERLGYH